MSRSSKESTPEFRWQTARTYDSLGTYLTGTGGTIIPAVTGKVLKIHYYNISTDGTVTYAFRDGGATRGTFASFALNEDGGPLNVPFIPWPNYHFQTSAGSPLFCGTAIQGINVGTAHINFIYTDQDAS